MKLLALYLHQFRLFEESTYQFGNQANMIVGDNARGKTTLLEAVYFLITGRSFRTSQLSDLVREGEEGFYLDAKFVKCGIEQRLRVTCKGKERKIFYNNTPCPSLSSLLGLLQGVVLTPDDASLVKGAPGLRRHFLDVQNAQSDPLYVHHLTRYMRAMRQRNHLLRAKNVSTIESWEYEMAKAALYITEKRQLALEDLQERAREIYGELSGEEGELTLTYKASLPDPQNYLMLLKKNRERELILGQTVAGPHKDDILISLKDKELRHFGSEGQQRSAVIALKLAEWKRLNAISQEPPLMLLDDVCMSLDEHRRKKLFGYLEQLGQVFITTTHKDSFKEIPAEMLML